MDCFESQASALAPSPGWQASGGKGIWLGAYEANAAVVHLRGHKILPVMHGHESALQSGVRFETVSRMSIYGPSPWRGSNCAPVDVVADLHVRVRDKACRRHNARHDPPAVPLHGPEKQASGEAHGRESDHLHFLHRAFSNGALGLAIGSLAHLGQTGLGTLRAD